MNTYPAGLRIPEHAYPHPYMCFVVRGSYREWNRGRLSHYSAGTAHFHVAGDRQHVEVTGDGAICLSVSPSDYEPRSGCSEVDTRPLGDLREELILTFLDSAAAAEARLARIGSVFLQRMQGLDPFPPPWLQLVESHLRSNEVRTVAELAEEVGVHPIHVWKSFRHWYGQTPKDYSRRVRIDRAKALLVESRSPLSEIAAELGFSDESHFIRVFKAAERVTPAKYRRDAAG
jgi:AraC family transcriptional regulator